MLKYLSKLRSICKGDLNIIHSNSRSLKLQQVGSRLIGIIPILSIFAFLGIITYSTVAIGFGTVDGEVYADTTTYSFTSASSLIIDNNAVADDVIAMYSGITYSSHTVRVKADNAFRYDLTITGPATLTNGSTIINGAGNKTPANMTDNTWGYGWGTTTTNDANMYYKSFTGSAQSLTSASTTSGVVDLTRKLVFAAKFSQNADAGHYQASVSLNLAITPVSLVAYSVIYDANGGTDAPVAQTSNTYDSNVTFNIAAQGNMKRSGYVFAGWSDSSTATKPSYEVGENISLTYGSPTKTLYAVWKSLAFPSTLTTMQGMTAAICDGVNIGVATTLTDSRDNKSYTIAKLSDEQCWMTKNLQLVNYTINGSNYTQSDVSYMSSGASYTIPNSPSGFTGTDDPNAAYYGNNANYGAYYTWYTATAGSGWYGMTSGNAYSSICPKGWRLPSGDITRGDYYVLYHKGPLLQWSGNNIWVGGSSASEGGAIFYAAGDYDNSTLYESGYSGHYWTSSPHASVQSSAYMMSFQKTYNTFYETNGNPKSRGSSIRCVARSN